MYSHACGSDSLTAKATYLHAMVMHNVAGHRLCYNVQLCML